MTKYDPKLLKKVNGTLLISEAKNIGIQNAEKVSKEQLIPAYLEAVEKADQSVLTEGIVNLYNEIVSVLGLDQAPPEEQAETGEKEVGGPAAAVPAPTPAPAPAAPPPKLATRVAPLATGAPKVVAAPPKSAKVAVPKEKLPPKVRYTRINAMFDALQEMGGGGRLEDLNNLASKKYMEHGGTDKIIEATFFCYIGLMGAQAVGAVKLEEDSYSVIK